MSNKKQDHIVDVNKKVTSVDWYIEKLFHLDYQYAKGLMTLGVWGERKNSLIEQAKEMHKEEIDNSHTLGYIIGGGNGDLYDCKQYYKQTYEQ